MNDEFRMANVEWAAELRASGSADSNDWFSFRFLNMRYTVATIGKQLDDDGCLNGITSSIVASPMRQLTRTLSSSPSRAIPSGSNKATVFSPNGATYDSPGHRPGSPRSIILSPEGASHLRTAGNITAKNQTKQTEVIA